jgi:hypothetical protein
MTIRNKFPSKIQIGPVEFKIELFDGLLENDATNGFYDGLEHLSEATIRIRTDLNEDIEKVTLLHEILHAIFQLNSIKDTGANHDLIHIISCNFYDILTRNPELVNYLKKKKK